MTEYAADRAALASLFPRGRFTKDDDRRCVLTARLARRAKDFVYVQANGSKLGIFYVGRGQAYRNALRGLILEEIEADGEGIIHAKWCAETASRLPWFDRKAVARPDRGWNFERAQIANEIRGSDGSGSLPDRDGVPTRPQEVTP